LQKKQFRVADWAQREEEEEEDNLIKSSLTEIQACVCFPDLCQWLNEHLQTQFQTMSTNSVPHLNQEYIAMTLSPRVYSNDSLSPRVSSNDSLFKSTWQWLCLQQYMAMTLSSRVHCNDSLCQPDPYIFSAYKMHTEGLYIVLSMKTDCWISQRSLTKVLLQQTIIESSSRHIMCKKTNLCSFQPESCKSSFPERRRSAT
jgi:hypothetical protein